MKKKHIIILVTLVLVAVVAIFAYLNMAGAKSNQALLQQQLISVVAGGQEVDNLNRQDLEKIGAQNFEASLDSSDSGPESYQYRGVLLKDALEELGIDLENYSSVVAKAVDGYTVAFDISEVNEQDNIYIAIEKDSQPLGDKDSGGSGPYQIIVKKDTFSQRWCKFLVELELKL